MAYTNTPEASTHQLRRIPVIAGQTIASDLALGTAETYTPTYQGQRYINCYPKRLELSNTDDLWVLTKTPAIEIEQKTYPNSGTDVIRAVSSDGRYLWKGRRLYLNDSIPLLVYTDSTDIIVKTMFQVVNPVSANLLYAGILKEPGGSIHSYTFDATTNTFTKSAAIPFAEDSDDLPWQSLFYNGRLFLIGKDKRIYNTPPGQYLTWNSTDFIVPEAKADELIAILLYKNYIAAFSTQSIEFFQDGAIELGSPLVRQEAYMQLFGVRSPINITQAGDTIFFLSYEDRYGYGVYTLDNFIVKRVSNFYVDGILNNQDITSIATAYTKLYVFDFYGDPCLGFNCGFSTSEYFDFGYIDEGYIQETSEAAGFPYVMYSTKQRQWFDFVFSDASGYLWNLLPKEPGFIQLPPNASLGQWKTYFVESYAANGVVNYRSFSKDYNANYSSVAEVVLDITDFGVYNWKHIKYVDAIGDFGNNEVSLSWTNHTNYTNWSNYFPKTQATLGHNNAIRWHNIGRHRATAFRLRFVGNSNIMFEGLDVAYNLGTK